MICLMQNDIPTDKRLLIIAGSGRKTGKTTLALEIINKFSSRFEIIGLKVCTKRDGEDKYHGLHDNIYPNTYSIYKETDPSLNKDTAKMLNAGVVRSYFIMTSVSKVIDSYIPIQRSAIKDNQFIVCESGSLREHIQPGIFIFLAHPEGTKDFKGTADPSIDVLVDISAESYEVEKLLESIDLGPSGWSLNKNQ